MAVTLPDPGRIAEVRRELHAGLTKVKDLLSAVEVADELVPELASTLGSMGRRMVLVLFGNQPATIRQVQDFWQAAVPAWRNGGHTAVVECLGDEGHLLPLEFLPLFDIAGCDDGVTDRTDFLRACRSFVGFSCVVRRRILPVPVARDGGIRPGQDGRLTVRYLQDDSLPGADVEREWLTGEASARVRLRGPYPNDGHTAADVAGHIFDPVDDRDDPDHVQHFSCHCDTTTTSPLDYELTLRGAGRALRLTLGGLGDHLVKLGARAPRPARTMPLVFLNACGSSRMDATSTLSFPKLFLENGNRGFLGTEVAIPDEEAAEFAVAFYRELLLGGASFGVAVHRARMRLLEKFGNPIGLAYSVYGNTDLQVVQQEASQR
ncbi:CHAT domain-containing protein [Saccharothrix sp. S26]|uniref:CHAT domain-containing protein n=1 Tax=Saccharothrix sp. S26 TaxID=2907215 RepID=UPI001F41E492|nr:CHAT domain-containing protein [Saccharothrix sp. S26]MCE6996223.1 CHAT domain-containing protein [Saccharothrix sp. S26]